MSRCDCCMMALSVSLLVGSVVLLALGIVQRAFWFDFAAWSCAVLAVGVAVQGMYCDD